MFHKQEIGINQDALIPTSLPSLKKDRQAGGTSESSLRVEAAGVFAKSTSVIGFPPRSGNGLRWLTVVAG